MKSFHLEIWMHPKKIIWEYLLFNLKIMCIICRFVIPFIGFQPFLGQESKGKKAGDDEKVNGFWFWWYRKKLHIVYCRQVYIYIYINLKLHYIYIYGLICYDRILQIWIKEISNRTFKTDPQPPFWPSTYYLLSKKGWVWGEKISDLTIAHPSSCKSLIFFAVFKGVGGLFKRSCFRFLGLDTLQKNHLGISSIWKSLPQICYPIYRASALLWPGGVQRQESWWWREGERVLILGASKIEKSCILCTVDRYWDYSINMIWYDMIPF